MEWDRKRRGTVLSSGKLGENVFAAPTTSRKSESCHVTRMVFDYQERSHDSQYIPDSKQVVNTDNDN